MSSRDELLPLVLAVKQGLMAQDQVKSCISRKKALAEEDSDVRLDDIAVGQGFLEPDQLKQLRQAATALTDKSGGISLNEACKIHIYHFEEKIGEGAMASVFRARVKKTGEMRAIKILHHEHINNRLFVERFIREGKLLRSFESENIARGFEYGRVKSAGLYFMGMELLEGVTLQDVLNQLGPYSEQKAVFCITEVARALAYMQSRGVVHRDIKPDNIMWCRDGRVVLVDLGFAKPIVKRGAKAEFEDETCGTVQYISPEQARGQADVDVRADIYSLGATLYHLVTGTPPFSGTDSMEIMSKQVLESLDPNALKNSRISGHMHYFIEKMMAKDREIRYQSAQEVVEDIGAVLDGAAELHYDPTKTGMFTAIRSGDMGARDSTRELPPGSDPRISSASRRNTSSMRLPDGNVKNRAPSSSQRVSRPRVSQVDNDPRSSKSVRMPEPRRQRRAQ